MAIQLPDPGNGIPEQKTGNDEWTNMKIVRDNFADKSNAASRLVGSLYGNVIEVGTNGLVAPIAMLASEASANLKSTVGNIVLTQTLSAQSLTPGWIISLPWQGGSNSTLGKQIFLGGFNSEIKIRQRPSSGADFSPWVTLWTSANATKDGNGFLKAASPVVDLYDDHIDLNIDAEMQGVEFIKNGTGDYTLKTKTGLRSDNTWQIEIPQDNNKNPLFAVDIDAQEDGTINIKCYKRIFSMETFLFGPDFNTPVDINEGRFISVRLNDNPEPEQTDEPAI